VGDRVHAPVAIVEGVEEGVEADERQQEGRQPGRELRQVERLQAGLAGDVGVEAGDDVPQVVGLEQVGAQPAELVAGRAVRQIGGVEAAGVEEVSGGPAEGPGREGPQVRQLDRDPGAVGQGRWPSRQAPHVLEDRQERRRLAQAVGQADGLLQAVGIADQAETGEGEADGGEGVAHTDNMRAKARIVSSRCAAAAPPRRGPTTPRESQRSSACIRAHHDAPCAPGSHPTLTSGGAPVTLRECERTLVSRPSPAQRGARRQPGPTMRRPGASGRARPARRRW
jgi:hypothetical protein